MPAVRKRVLILAVLIVAVGALAWQLRHSRKDPADSIMLYGNVDIRQVQLAFNDSERIERLLVDEGSAITKGELLGQLVQQRYADTLAQAAANAAAQQQVVNRLRAGSRPEEIAQARADVAAAQANLDAAQADLAQGEMFFHRQETLAGEQYVSEQVRDDAQRSYLAEQAAAAAAKQVLEARQQALRLAVIGPRKEDVAAAEATLRADEAALALAQKQLNDTEIFAPADGVIQDRILEPGDMAAPQTPVFTLALDNPVWVRAYLPEPQLGKVALGMRAWIESDSSPGVKFPGWIGYISPVSEFTPKSVETTQLRSQLVYRVRVFACNPDHRLRLGMPATVTVPLGDNRAHNISEHPCENH